MFLVTSKQMYAAETNAAKRGCSFPLLMENAGCACADIIENRLCKNGTEDVLVICGKGKNGGDGFVIARKLAGFGCNIKVMLVCGEPKAEDAVANYEILKMTEIEIIRYENDIQTVSAYIENADIIVDAIFGTGFSGRFDNRLAELAKKINDSKAKTVAIDVPSGADCDKACVAGEVVKADLTVAISAYKPIHIMKPYCSVCGKVVIADIGLTDADFFSLEEKPYISITEAEVKKMLPGRISVSHKGTYGHALCICASKRMVGAAYLSVSGALRCGAGLVTAAFPDIIYPVIVPKLNEPLFLPLSSNKEGTVSTYALTEISDMLEKKADAVLAGCGMGLNEDTKRFISGLIKTTKVPLVLDADGINALIGNIDILKEAKAPVILTPHPGEMSRICGKTVAEITADPVNIARDFAERNSVTLVLKTANTVVCSEDGNVVYINQTGNSGLSRGGSGDLLAGMIVSLLAQGMNAAQAAACAVYIHGLAADEVAKNTSMRGMLPGDLLECLPKLLSKFE